MSHPARPMKRPRRAKFETDGRTRPVAGYRREQIVTQAESRGGPAAGNPGTGKMKTYAIARGLGTARPGQH